MSYVGNTPTQQTFTPAVDYFSGDGSTVAFTLSRPVASVAQVQVNVNNVQQNPGSAYTVSGNTITFTGAPSAGTNNIYVYYTSPITQVIQPGQGTVGTAQIQDGAVVTQGIANAAVTSAKLASGAAVGNIGYTPVNNAGDTMTGQLTAIGLSNTFTTALSDYRTQSPNASTVLLVGPPGDRDSWIYRDPAGGAVNWGVYHRQIDSAVANLPGNSIGFVGNDQLAAYIDLQNKRIRSMTAVDQPYQMVVRQGGYTVPDGTTDISYDLLVHSRYMSHASGTLMYFEQPGKYLITTGWRFGTGGDVWTGVRLRDSDGTVRGIGFGTGQVNNDPGPCQISFIADIPAGRVNQAMSMQFVRLGSSMGIGSPNTTAGYAIVTTVVQVGV